MNSFNRLSRTLFAGVGAAMIAGAAHAAADITFTDTRIFPESLTSSADGTVYIGSVSHDAVYRALPGTTVATQWITKEKGNLSGVFGVLADDASNTLWVCSTVFGPPGAPGAPPAPPPADGPQTALKAFDLKTGTAKGSYAFPGGGFCNDIAVAKDGTAYASDVFGARVLRLKAGSAALDVWASDAKLLPGVDGVAVLDDGAVYVNSFQTNQILRIPVAKDGNSGPIVALTTSRPIKSPDGMRTIGPMTMLLIEGQSGTLSKVTVSGDKAQVDDVKTGLVSPSAVTLVKDTAYVTEAKLNYQFDPSLRDKDPGPFKIVAVPYPAK